MEFKGTKGVWEFVENKNFYSVETLEVVDKPYWAICDTITKKEEDKANAQLIAHSPLLLEAIKDSIEELRERGLFNMADYHEKLYNQCVTF